MLCRTEDNDERIYRIWTDAITETIQNEEITEEGWAALWRDVLLLPESDKVKIIELIWQTGKAKLNRNAVVSAFLTP